jgi:hypothetical protein
MDTCASYRVDKPMLTSATSTSTAKTFPPEILAVFDAKMDDVIRLPSQGPPMLAAAARR